MGFALRDRLGLRFGGLSDRARLFLRLHIEGCRHHDRNRRCRLHNGRRVGCACNVLIPLRVNGCLRRLGFIHTRSGGGRCCKARSLLCFLRGDTLPIGFAQCLLVGIALLGRLRINAQVWCTGRRRLLLPK
ncbi:hypothetical protein Xvtw_13365 [Xanthomonas campestris pv. vitiswoodrowii]|nr:hypothetical protein Xvtw_13365 [Xanthomonas campestris pv. vitiswoodrowii]